MTTPQLNAPIDERVAGLAAQASGVSDRALANEAAVIQARLRHPLRLAIAGRVKAGKSTLLNALVGERLAPTDAGECTRIVSVYHEAVGYQVAAVKRDGTRADLAFERSQGELKIELGALSPYEVEFLDVGWPSSALHDLTLIDTPGLASATAENSLRTREFLAIDEDRSNQADGVIYLMVHMHRTDADFLDAFLDRSVGASSPVNSVAVLSRADEIGASRLDAMQAAATIANRYRSDDRLSSLCATVLPVAGLLAESALTLREDEAAALRLIAVLDERELERLLLSADRFASADADAGLEVSAEFRRRLLQRLGMFGLRMAVDELKHGRVRSASDLSRLLLEASGVPLLRAFLDEHFAPRARVLKARSALRSLRRLMPRVAEIDPGRAAILETEMERLESTSNAFGELRLAHLVMSGAVDASPDEREEISRLTAGRADAERLGLPADAPTDAKRAAALEAVARWRRRADDPLSERLTVEAAEIAARSYEQIYAAISQ